MKRTGENVIRIEAEALRRLADRIAGPMGNAFTRALDLMFECRGRVVVTGMGKSGHIGRKIAATLASTGTPALFVHPAEASHGDLGMIVDRPGQDDAVAGAGGVVGRIVENELEGLAVACGAVVIDAIVFHHEVVLRCVVVGGDLGAAVAGVQAVPVCRDHIGRAVGVGDGAVGIIGAGGHAQGDPAVGADRNLGEIVSVVAVGEGQGHRLGHEL